MVAVPPYEKRVWRFGEFFVDADSRMLLRNDDMVVIGPKAFDLLVILLQRRGEILSKRVLLNTVWPDTIVDANNLNQQIAALRKALDDSRCAWIETVPRVGFRFRSEEKRPTQGARPVRTSMLITVIAVALLVLVPRLVPRIPPARSIAILPLRAEAGSGRDAYLGLAIADALTNRFAGAKQLTVRPVSASRRYIDRAIEPREVGRELQVDAVIAGTVARAEDTLTVAIRLVRVEDGKQLWSHRFTSKPDRLFSFPDRIYQSIASEIGVTPAVARGEYRPPEAAYEAYLQGMYFFSRRRESDVIKAESLFRTALAIDPNYAAAWAGLCDALGFQGKDEAVIANARALELDDSLAEAHTNLGLGSLLTHYDFALARREFERALALDPNNPHTHHWYAYYFVAIADFNRALAEIETARRLDPGSSIIQTDVGNILFRARRYHAAIVQLEGVIRGDPTFAQAHKELALAYELAGRHDDAVREMLRAAELNERVQRSAILAQVYAAAGRKAEARHTLETAKDDDPSYICMAYAALGEKEAALGWLERAYAAHSAEVALINANPLFDSLRNEPRLAAIAQRLRP